MQREDYRECWTHYGHDPKALTVGAGSAGLSVAATSQEARAAFQPAFAGYLAAQRRLGVEPVFATLDDYVERSSALVGSPAQVLEKVRRYHERFGHTVLHVGADAQGVSEGDHHRSLELFADAVLPTLRSELPDPPVWGPGPLDDDSRARAASSGETFLATG